MGISNDSGLFLGFAAVGVLGAAAAWGGREGGRATFDKPVIPWELVRKHAPHAARRMARVLDGPDGTAGVWRRYGIPGEPDPNSDVAYMVDYLLGGERVYVLGPVMQDVLMRTSLAKVPPEVVRLPHRALYLALPGDRWSIWQQDRGWLPVKGVYVRASIKGALDFLAWAPESVSRIDDANISYMRLDLVEAGRLGMDLEDYAALLVGESPETRRREFERILRALGGESLSEDTTSAMQATMRDLVRLIINTLLYINSEGADLTLHPWTQVQLKTAEKIHRDLQKVERMGGRPRRRERARAKLEQKRARLSKARAVWLGRDIEEGRVREAVKAPKGLSPGRDPSLYELERVGVAGHWKVPWSKGIRRIRWVQPYTSHRWKRKKRGRR